MTFPTHCITIKIKGKPVTLADWLPRTGWSLDQAGYVVYTSRRKQPLIKRGERAHRVTLRALGAILTREIHVHHQNFNKLNNAPGNLLACPAAFNPTCVARCPWTGRFMSKGEYLRMVA